MPGKALLLVPSDTPEKGMGKKSMDGGEDYGNGGGEMGHRELQKQAKVAAMKDLAAAMKNGDHEAMAAAFKDAYDACKALNDEEDYA